MSLTDSMVRTLQTHGWAPVEILDESDRLQLFPLSSKLGAGFTLWHRGRNGEWSLVTSGHTEGGELRAPAGERLTLPGEAEETLEALLARA